MCITRKPAESCGRDENWDYFTLDTSISPRDQDGICKTLSGPMKLVHPTGEGAEEEVHALLDFAVEGRKRVKDSILWIDATIRGTPVRLRYSDGVGAWHDITTLEGVVMLKSASARSRPIRRST